MRIFGKYDLDKLVAEKPDVDKRTLKWAHWCFVIEVVILFVVIGLLVRTCR